jgi:ATP-dependent RNA helicase SUPV3L1/SUV3
MRRLLPEAEIVSRPRFSHLSYKGQGKLARLPARAAVVAFSTNEVYNLAEHLRRFRGGTAVVLGALSPRTRNAQVGMFESGEVDYLVATDAIGMGLNLSLDHVAFSSLSKFDGRRRRRLTAQETAQIAGRAGRHMADGSFGTTESAGAMPEEIVTAVENHQFEPISGLYWRNRKLDFRSLDHLLRSLEARSNDPQLLAVRDAPDHQVLTRLAQEPEVAAIACHKQAVRLLWEVCQLPDFHAIRTGQHASTTSKAISIA